MLAASMLFQGSGGSGSAVNPITYAKEEKVISNLTEPEVKAVSTYSVNSGKDQYGNSYSLEFSVWDSNSNEYVPFEENGHLKDQARSKVDINWTLYDGEKEFRADLGDFKPFDTNNFAFKDANGHWVNVSVVEQGGKYVLIGNYPENCNCSGRTASVSMEGSIDWSNGVDESGDSGKFKIGDFEIPFTPDFSGGDVTTDKTNTGKVSMDQNGEYFIEYTVRHEIKSAVNGLVLSDLLPVGLTINPEDVSVIVKNNGIGENYEYVVNFENQLLTITFPENQVIPGNTEITYTYKALLNEEILGEMLSKNKSLINTATAVFEGGTSSDTNGFPSYPTPKLSKAGEVVKDQDGNPAEPARIKWTIVYRLEGFLSFLEGTYKDTWLRGYNDNSWNGDYIGYLASTGHREDLIALMQEFGIQTTLRDTLSEGNTFPDGTSSKSFDIFEMDYIGNGAYRKVIQSNQLGEGPWGNTVTAGDLTGYGEVKDGEHFGVEKTGVETNESESSITWEITIPIPTEDIDSIMVHDMPVNELDDEGLYPLSAYRDSWDPFFDHWQRADRSTIQINGKDLEELIQNEYVSLSDEVEDGFELTIYKDLWRSESSIKITFKTFLYQGDTEIKDNDPFPIPSYYQNNVDVAWFDGAEEKSYESTYGKVEEGNGEYQFIKESISREVSGSDDLWEQTWSLLLTSPTFSYNLNTNLKSFVFEDTLPEGTEYVDGSARFVLWAEDYQYQIENYEEFLQYQITTEEIEAFYSTINQNDISATIASGKLTISIDEAHYNNFINRLNNYQFSNGITGNEFIRNYLDFNLAIQYKTQIKDMTAFQQLWRAADKNEDGSFTLKFKNRVNGTINDELAGTRSAEVSENFNKVLHKSNVWISGTPNDKDSAFQFSKQPIEQYHTQGDHYYKSVFFQIEVNRDRILYTGDKDGKLTLLDKMGVDLEYIPGSEQVSKILRSTDIQEDDDWYEILGENEYSVSASSDNQEIEFTVPDGEYLIVSYWAKVPEKVMDEITDASNVVTLSGMGEAAADTDWVDKDGYAQNSGSADNQSLSINITKMDEGQNTIEGAEFKLIQLAFSEDTAEGATTYSLEVDDSAPNSVDGVYTPEAASTGYDFAFTGLSKGAIYLLEEVKSPEGYAPIDPFIFACAEYDSFKEHTGTHDDLTIDEINDILSKNKVVLDGVLDDSLQVSYIPLLKNNDKGAVESAYDGLRSKYAFKVHNEKVSDLTLSKRIEGTPTDPEAEYHFIVKLFESQEDQKNGVTAGINETFGDITFENGIGEASLKKDESFSLRSVPEKYFYSIEESAGEWEVIFTDVNGQPISSGGRTIEGSFADSDHIQITAINLFEDSEYEMPETGGNNYKTLLKASGATFFTAIVAYILRRKYHLLPL